MKLIPANAPVGRDAVVEWLQTLKIVLVLPGAPDCKEILGSLLERSPGTLTSLTLEQGRDIARNKAYIAISTAERTDTEHPLELSLPKSARLYLDVSAPKAGIAGTGCSRDVLVSEVVEKIKTGEPYIIKIENTGPANENPLAAYKLRIALECGVNTDSAVLRYGRYLWRLHTQANKGEFYICQMRDVDPDDALLVVDLSELDPNAEDFEGVKVYVHRDVYTNLQDDKSSPGQYIVYTFIIYEVIRAILSDCTAKEKGSSEYPGIALRIAKALAADTDPKETLDDYRENPYTVLALIQKKANLLQAARQALSVSAPAEDSDTV